MIANYQYGEPSPKEKAKMDLMATISADHAFDFLRTKNQLGYICFSMLPRIGDYYSFSIIVGSQRDKFTCEDVYSKITQYHSHFIQTLENMSHADFETHKRSLIQALNRSPTNLTERMATHLSTLLSGKSKIDFNARQKKVNLVYDITKQEIIDIYASKVQKNPSIVLVAVEGIPKKDIETKSSFELQSLDFEKPAISQFKNLNDLRTAIE